MSPLTRVALAALALCASGCPGGFVEPNPPELERVEWTYTAGPEDRPLLYGVIFDLHLADPERCSAVKETLRRNIRTVLTAAVPGAEELAETDVTGNTCVQETWRSFSAYDVQNTAIAAARQHPAGTIRPLFVYVNNVDAIPSTVEYALRMLRNPAYEFAAAPLLWGVVLPRVKAQVSFERTTPWTYAADPALFAPMEEASSKDLPLQGTAPATVDVFTVTNIQGMSWMKSCSTLPSGVTAVNFTADGHASPINLARPPALHIPGMTPPTPKSAFVPPQYQFVVESCFEHCDRYLRYTGHYRRWLQARGCHETSRVDP